VDIERIVEFGLKIDIIPTPGLARLSNADALITSNWEAVYIDNAKYMDERYQSRIRFSLAHEIGHFILHKKLYGTFGINDITDFYKFFEQISTIQYGYLESQANKFANLLLIPRGKLSQERNSFLRDLEAMGNMPSIEDENVFNSYLAIPMAKVFGVSEKVAEIALGNIRGEK
jgi:Predicted Zn peptidase